MGCSVGCVAAVLLTIFVTDARCQMPWNELKTLPYELLQFLSDPEASGWATDALGARCRSQLEFFGHAVQHGDPRAIEMFDSWGKMPAGLLFGNGHDFGNYDQCRRVAITNGADVAFGGQHCTVMVDVRVLRMTIPQLQYGICVPDRCEPATVQQLLDSFFVERGMKVVNELSLFCYRDEVKSFSSLTVVAIVLFSCYGAILVLAAVVDAMLTLRKRNIPTYVARFSAYTNLRKIFQTNPQSRGKSGTLDCVNGIRSLAMLWIIVNHVHDTTYGIPAPNPITRTEYANSYFGTLFHRLGGKAVDIFLMLSGMLVSLKILRELDRNRTLNILEFWTHRIIRLTPAYAALIFFAVAFTEHFGEGLYFKSALLELVTFCEDNWWSALLYVQNYAHQPTMCFAHTWYLAVDMQLYILAPLFVYPLWKYGRRFVPVIALLAVLSMGCVFATFMVNEYRLNRTAPPGDGLMAKKTYHPTHTRMAVWLFGVLFGYLLDKTKGHPVRLPRIALAAGWLMAVAIVTLTGYSLKQLYVGDYTRYGPLADAFYESLHRPLWALVAMWIIFVCINGQGGPVDQFLSWRFWQPVARLSYSMYLLHIWIQVVTVPMQIRAPVYFSLIGVLNRIFGLTAQTAAAAIVWAIAFEYPFFGLEKRWFAKRTQQETP